MNDAGCFFAAANGYSGFRSYFDNIFSPDKLKKLYILKGGPGTGKSTLMKTIAKRFSDEACVTRIYCSSDVSSLDGILIEQNGNAIGIADGTAPHVIEPRFPGAVEEIVNLGDGFDCRALYKQNNVIRELSEKKSYAYKNAYALLAAAGDIRKCIHTVLLDNDIYTEAERYARELVRDTKACGVAPDDRVLLLCSFSKDGYTFLPERGNGKKIISIDGDGFTEYLIIREIRKILFEKTALLRSYESALSSEFFDAVECEEVVFKVSQKGESTSLTCPWMFTDNSYLEMKKAHEAMLSIAQKFFVDASVHHFALEKIYSENMSFKNNDAKIERLCADITELFA